ncbi:MAG: MATE family efflux transporter, partial [Paracoccaceae bacterium]|nr:MATE family efflux transporter [Paracoccaceae bacterium]
GVGVVAVLALAFSLAGGLNIDIMTRAPEVRLLARDYLPWMVLAPLIGIASWMLDGVFIGATRTRDMRIAMIISTAIYALAVALLLPLWGNNGLWAALMIFFAARAVTLALRYPALEAQAKRA